MMLRWGLYMTWGRLPDGRTLAVISDGSPQYGDSPVTVLEIETGLTEAEAKIWYKRMKRERPWETRQ